MSMLRLEHLALNAVLSAAIAACAAPQASTLPVSPSSQPASQPIIVRIEGASAECKDATRTAMTLEEATAVFDAFRADVVRQVPIEPLRAPKSIDHVLDILRRDQIDLFPVGIAYARSLTGVRARVLEAQLELAWGEALVMVAQLLERQTMNAAVQSLQSRARAAMGAVGQNEQKALAAIAADISRVRRLTDAMWVLAPVHIELGARLASKLLEEAPGDYHGYRVAADYFRLRGDWSNFDRMIKEVEQRKPDSTGLQFLLGVAVVDRTGNKALGAAKLQEALTSDPKFAKAQAMMLLLADSPPESYAALVKLNTINPNHQLVVLIGPMIASAYEAWSANAKNKQQGADEQDNVL